MLRGWSHGKTRQVSSGGAGASGASGVRAAADAHVAAIESIAVKIGCKPETLRKWVRRAERD
jgi:transposase-like protein